MERKSNNDNWVRCPVCRHKLFKKLVSNGDVLIEIKCSSCKSIFEILLADDIDKEEK